MSASLNEAAAAGNLEEVLMRLNLGEDVNQGRQGEIVEATNRSSHFRSGGTRTSRTSPTLVEVTFSVICCSSYVAAQSD